MFSTTLGQLLINEALPEELKDHQRVLDKKGMQALFQEVADKHPEKYRDVAKALADVGRDAVSTSGGYSFGIRHLRQANSAKLISNKIRSDIDKVLNSNISDKEKEEQIILITGRQRKNMEESVYQESLAENNPLATQVKSGTRGNPTNLSSLRGSDLQYVDHRDRIIPIPILRSFSQGLTPVEYFANSFGARKGVVDVKEATRDAGYFSKQLNQASHRLVVSGLDHDKPLEGLRGMPAETIDMDNEGSLLAHDIGSYKRNTVLTPKILSDLHNRGINKILVRSPIVGGPEDGGVYARDVGVRERGMVAPIGDQVGIAAAQSLSEGISQGSLASKHSGGIAGAAQAVSGFKLLDQLVQVPKHFPGGAAHAKVDGIISSVEEAPAGGNYININGERHYVAAGHEVKVKRGEHVEAGDVLSDGIPNPAEIVAHKGIGEGRRYFTDLFKKSMQESGLGAHRRNVELLARGLINHVRLTEENGDNIPGDVVHYNILEHNYQPRPGHMQVEPKRALDHYLERPVLHYSIGTRIKPSVIKDLDHFQVKNVLVHKDPPPFEPEMVRGMTNISYDPDWLTRMLGSNLEKSLLSSTHRGMKSDETGTSFVPSMARGVDFGIKGKVRDWHKPLQTVL